MHNLDGLSQQELAVLYATRESENVQTLSELAETVEASPWRVGQTLDQLVEKQILQEVNSFDLAGNDAICYGYHNESEIAQCVYEAIYNVDPI